jgi:hypothetical protein
LIPTTKATFQRAKTLFALEISQTSLADDECRRSLQWRGSSANERNCQTHFTITFSGGSRNVGTMFVFWLMRERAPNDNVSLVSTLDERFQHTPVSASRNSHRSLCVQLCSALGIPLAARTNYTASL